MKTTLLTVSLAALLTAASAQVQADRGHHDDALAAGVLGFVLGSTFTAPRTYYYYDDPPRREIVIRREYYPPRVVHHHHHDHDRYRRYDRDHDRHGDGRRWRD